MGWVVQAAATALWAALPVAEVAVLMVDSAVVAVVISLGTWGRVDSAAGAAAAADRAAAVVERIGSWG